MLEYKFKEGEEGKPANERIIEKRGDVVEFSFVGMKHDTVVFEKTLKELIANRDLKAGIMNNVATHHPFVKDMEDADMNAINMYYEAKKLVKAYDEKIAEISTQYDQYKEEIKEVENQLPELTLVPSPIVNTEATEVAKSVDEESSEENEQ